MSNVKDTIWWRKAELRNAVKTSYSDKETGLSAQEIGEAIFNGLPKEMAVKVVEELIHKLSGF